MDLLLSLEAPARVSIIYPIHDSLRVDPLTCIMLFLGRNHSYGEIIPLSDFSTTCKAFRQARNELITDRRMAIIEYAFYGRVRATS